MEADAQSARSRTIPTHYKFEEIGVRRRAALGLLPDTVDPDSALPMQLSPLKSSRMFRFAGPNTATLDGGYRLCRATRAFTPGAHRYYWEFEFAASSPPGSHVRLGIATVGASMEAPVGFDAEGYCVRDLGGAFHKRRRRPSRGFSPGSVIGFGLYDAGGAFALRLYIDGADEGAVFEGIDLSKQWLPALSIYKGATVTARFARPFAFDPGAEWTAASDAPPAEVNSSYYTADFIINIMHTAIPGDERQQTLFRICQTALTPVHEMPI